MDSLTNLLRTLDVIWSALTPRQQATRLGAQFKAAQAEAQALSASLAADPVPDEDDEQAAVNILSELTAIYRSLGRKAAASLAGQELKTAKGFALEVVNDIRRAQG